ncbi:MULTISPECIES: metallophosphoesterase [Sphingobacterium]|uniref:metallophosphoesterase n=1 Tax=Sphingobacterium TaxID=28453 RepID=UPI000DF944B5|nr:MULTISPECIES: metallophosphoesterase [Sphingobacterium]QQT42837.1 metallophosphoesterase [Sphingobacterium multivorum]SUJ02172.1 diadenosine tetraphosphatase [Sphingobacterium multivorum]HAE68748.1 metallophosphatase [Sphingobacterium sp.]
MKIHLKAKHGGSYGIAVIWYLFVLFGVMQGAVAQSALELGKFDGPYFFYENGDSSCIRVEHGQVLSEKSEHIKAFKVSTEDGKHQFEVWRHPMVAPAWSYRPSKKIVVLSDPHGDFESFYSILNAQKVIGLNYEWTFGSNQLVIIGDVFDRGKDVLPIFWLIYKLEYEAAKAGGQVHFLFGNHEEMVLRGNYKYTQEKYKALAEKVGRDYRDFWSVNTELGKWLQTKNTMEKIGDNLFVHAGLSAAMLDPQWSISAVNDSVRHHLFQQKEERQKSKAATFLFGSEGPLWYRGMVREEEKYLPLPQTELEKLMDVYGARKIFVGHTIFPEVSKFYAGKVYAVNVANEANRLKGHSRGVLLQGAKVIILYDDASKNKYFASNL